MAFIRSIGRWTMAALVINCIIGGGIFGLPGELNRLLGRASPVAVIFAAVAVGVIMACVAEVASQFLEPGGAYLYVRTAFGRFLGMQIGWIELLSVTAGVAALANLLVDYLCDVPPVASEYLGAGFANRNLLRCSRGGELSRCAQRRHSKQRNDRSQTFSACFADPVRLCAGRTSPTGNSCIGNRLPGIFELAESIGIPAGRLRRMGVLTNSHGRSQRTASNHSFCPRYRAPRVHGDLYAITVHYGRDYRYENDRCASPGSCISATRT